MKCLSVVTGLLIICARLAVGAELTASRSEMEALRDAWLADPEKPVAAHPDAAVYPGAVKPGAAKIDKTVQIDLSVPRWHSTGVYALPGEPVTILIKDSLASLGLKVRVGVSPRDLSRLDEWKRHPVVSCEVPLTKKRTTVYNPFGGLVHIVVPATEGLKGVKPVKISGGIMAPWYVRGKTEPAAFIKECQTTAAPYGEIESRHFVIMAETAGLRKTTKARALAIYWDMVLDACQDLAQWKERRSPERICSDVQLTAGWMHSGYPIMTHINDKHFDWAIDDKALRASEAWGLYHELGHNHQNVDWTPSVLAEVTVNLFTTYVIETVGKKSWRKENFFTGADKSKARVRTWVDKGHTFDDLVGDPFLALEPFLRIQEAYGWDVYKKAFAEYLKPGFNRPVGDDMKWQVLAKELSRAADADLASVFAAWSIPMHSETLAACASYPPAKPALTAGLPQSVRPRSPATTLRGKANRSR